VIAMIVEAGTVAAPPLLKNLTEIIAAVGALGTAAFGLVDATKVLWGGVNNIGFGGIEKRIRSLVPEATTNALGVADVLETLKGNWFNGTELGSQKAIAKSLIKLNFNEANAELMAKATRVDKAVLTTVAASVRAGTALTAAQSDVYGRFDLILTALLDETYQRADQKYRNGARAWATVVSVLLAWSGAIIVNTDPAHVAHVSFWVASGVGVLATPLAPIAKDLSSALATAVNGLQAFKK